MINNKIKEELKKRRITIEELSKVLNFTYSYTHRIVSGKIPLNNLEILRKISDYIGVPITYWFDDSTNNSVVIGSHNQINGNNNKVEVQLKSDIEKLKNEIDNLKIQLRLKDELIELLREQVKTLKKLE